jgi:hypothetical protein
LLSTAQPGVPVQVFVGLGAEVAEGDPLVVVESMKMENTVRAPCAGLVAELHSFPGAQVGSSTRTGTGTGTGTSTAGSSQCVWICHGGAGLCSMAWLELWPLGMLWACAWGGSGRGFPASCRRRRRLLWFEALARAPAGRPLWPCWLVPAQQPRACGLGPAALGPLCLACAACVACVVRPLLWMGWRCCAGQACADRWSSRHWVAVCKRGRVLQRAGW